MFDRILRIVCCVLVVFLSGCSSLESYDSDWLNQILYTPTPAPERTATPTPGAEEATQSPTGQPEPAVAEPRILRIWLPPQFNPNINNSSASLFKERLNDFEAAHPGLEIDVRIKSETGEADLLNSLSITSMAAPGAMPDLIALPRNSLESAAQKGLVLPLDEISRELQNPDWHPYARELAEIGGTSYGLPFAGDALVIVYRPELVWIKTWNDILLSEGRLIFAGADPQAEVALSLYASAGGELTDAQGDPTFDQDVLISVLELFSRGRGVSLFPEAVKNISIDDQVLQEYRTRRTEMAVFHFSKFRDSQDGLFQPLMGLGDETHYTFATGWMWALTNQPPDNQQLSIELMEYLTEDEFLSAWINETGYLPTRRFTVNEDANETVAAVIEASQAVPSADVLLVLGPHMQKALIRVLNGEQPEAVARSVIEELR
jgi:multiple sugar transport system substrate-binding protein